MEFKAFRVDGISRGGNTGRRLSTKHLDVKRSIEVRRKPEECGVCYLRSQRRKMCQEGVSDQRGVDSKVR